MWVPVSTGVERRNGRSDCVVLLSWGGISFPLDGKIVRSANNGGGIVALSIGKPSVENTGDGKKKMDRSAC